MTAAARAVRERLVEVLKKELMGPSAPDEVIGEYPTSRYIVGRLAPARSSDDDTDAKVPTTENDVLAAGEDSGEEGSADSSPPLIVAFNPSSFGLSFLVDAATKTLRAEISWGDYTRQKSQWHRMARSATVDGIPIGSVGKIGRILLSSTARNVAGVVVSGTDDDEIVLEGVVHEFVGYRAVSLFLVNRRTKGRVGDRTKDERWIYQPQLTVSAPEGTFAFVAKDAVHDRFVEDDGDAASNALLYRDAREFATGHGVAAAWGMPSIDGHRVNRVWSEVLPQHEVPLLVAPQQIAPDAVLDMKLLSQSNSAVELAGNLEPLIKAYEDWIAVLRDKARSEEILADPELSDAAETNVGLCAEAANRMRKGLSLLKTDARAFSAFKFANLAMWDQRIHSLWAASNRQNGSVGGEPSSFDVPNNRTWRPFQLGFILLNLCGIADEGSDDRRIVDLLWFPTGGGKTEAYLGLSAFTLAIRRLRGDRHGMHGGAGVSIIMRYTLRLLTVQQFQRAAALIAACEVHRRSDPAMWGTEPFRIGVWVGSRTTPNRFEESQSALEDLKDGKKPREGSPVQLVSCPRCGTSLLDGKGRPSASAYQLDGMSKRTLVWCPNDACEFGAKNSVNQGLPVVVVDDEIYRTCPSLVVATVDKFARLPFRGEARSLFGLRDRFSPTFGHLTAAHGDSVAGKKIRDALSAPRLLPPELIIQDELHLISGPLGTMVGLYETAVDYASSLSTPNATPIHAKVIASTATIRRAAQQTHQLYGGRRLSIFPPSGLSASDSFFAKSVDVDPEMDETAGRLYLGINAPGSSTKTLLVRVYAALLAAAEIELQRDSRAADPYGTMVGYFNSLRALGGAKRLVEDDVRIRLKYLANERSFPRRTIFKNKELTSRIDSWGIPALLKELEARFPRAKNDWPVDILLATNMISVGVDIDRLGLMVVTGQPKTTAEYIQATSRVGRKFPGLVVTMYNWLGARDLSHYERFESYHAALYRHVEAISVTPFSSRALDRGLKGAFAAMNRLMGPSLAQEPEAENFDPMASQTNDVIEHICQRAAALVGKENSDLVRKRLEAYRDEWAHLTNSLLRYSWYNSSTKPPNNSRVLLRTAGSDNPGEWPTPGSLREVEPTAAFFLDEDDL